MRRLRSRRTWRSHVSEGPVASDHARLSTARFRGFTFALPALQSETRSATSFQTGMPHYASLFQDYYHSNSDTRDTPSRSNYSFLIATSNHTNKSKQTWTSSDSRLKSPSCGYTNQNV